MKLSTVLALATLTAFRVLADNVDCIASTDTGTRCAATVEAGAFGYCPGGYTSESLSAPGQSYGVYCTRGCTPEEQADCDAQNCDDYSKACRPGTPFSCQLAIDYCKGTVSDYICYNTPGYTQCEYTDKCQPDTIDCCPPGDVGQTYITLFINTLKNGPKTVLLLAETCASNDQATATKIDNVFSAKGFPLGKTNRAKQPCGIRSIGTTYLNATKSDYSMVNAIRASNKVLCESNGGTFISKNNM